MKGMLSIKFVQVDPACDLYPDDPNAESFEGIGISARGCGCCSKWEQLTPQLLEEAIKDTEAFLEALKSMIGRL